MYHKTSIYRRISLVMGVTTLLLGLVPVPVLGRVGMVSADDSVVSEPAPVGVPLPPLDDSLVQVLPLSDPAVEPLAEPPADPPVEPVAPELLVVNPALVPDGNALSPEEAAAPESVVLDPATEPALSEIVPPDVLPLDVQPADALAGDLPPVEEPAPEPLFGDFSMMRFGAVSLFSLSSAIGDDPAIAGELPGFGVTYSNGDCVTNNSCVTDEPVTNPNDYTDQGTYGEKDYTLPDIGGNTANIVAVKRGNDWFFFKVGSGAACDETTFCVEFDGSGNVKVYSYETQANGYLGYNMIHFWYVTPPVPGCMDQTATNFNPEATEDDGSCEYVVTIPGCMDATANNFNPEATEDDGSCAYDIPGCMDATANNFNSEATKDDGSCTYDIPGCTDATANNFNSEATKDDGSCTYDIPGCMDQVATNFNPDATKDDGSCEYEQQRLGLTLNAVCTPGEDGYHLAWFINNPNGTDVNASWDLNGSNGSGAMSPGSNFIGNTPTGNGSYTMNASWGFGEASKSAQALCKPGGGDTPDETTTTLVVAPQNPLIIPVTGADLDGSFPLYRRLMLLAGSTLLTSGLFLKGTVKKEKKLKK
jgi:hypothetical protein